MYVCMYVCIYVCIYLCKRFYLFIFRERGREEGEGGRKKGKRWCERETSVSCLCTLPNWGLNQPRYVPWLGIEPVTICFAGKAQCTGPHWSGPCASFKSELLLQAGFSLVCHSMHGCLPSPANCTFTLTLSQSCLYYGCTCSSLLNEPSAWALRG